MPKSSGPLPTTLWLLACLKSPKQKISAQKQSSSGLFLLPASGKIIIEINGQGGKYVL
jgi:hypothetical protein